MEKFEYRLIRIVLVLPFLFALTAGIALADIPNPGTAVVDGHINEWNLSIPGPDFFADMWEAGKPEKPNADINAKDSIGWEPLPYAMAGGHEDVTRLLIERGADIHAKGPNGGGLLDLAVQLGQKDIVRLLLAKGIDVNAKGYLGRTCLHALARVAGNSGTLGLRPAEITDIAELLLAQGADVNARYGYYGTPLRIARATGMQTELVELLVKHGAREW